MQLPTLFLPFSLSICLLVYLIIFPNTWVTECAEVFWALPGECACCPSFLLMLSCLWFYFPHHGRSVPNVGCIPFVSLTPGMVMWQAVLYLLDPTLNVLSFISQAHYLDRVVKGMVFLPLFSLLSLCVCLCISIKEEMYI